MIEKKTHHWKLSELAASLQETIESSFRRGPVWVLAEISEFKKYNERSYCFLTLSEKENEKVTARLEAVIWKQQMPLLDKFKAECGMDMDKDMQVLILVKPVFHPQFGLRLVLYDADASYTLGKLELQRQKVLNQILQLYPNDIKFLDGQYVSLNHKVRIPLVCKRIALITAPDSEGMNDFVHELESNIFSYSYCMRVFPALVQGQQAAADIVQKLNEIEEQKELFDLVVIARGGGSLADLGPFDALELGVKIARFPIPVICGIGHHRNVSVADLLCHSSVKTPTRAAAFLNDHNRAFEERVISAAFNISRLSVQKLKQASQDLLRKQENIRAAVQMKFKNVQNQLEKADLILKLANPVNLLEKGFALVMQNEKIVPSLSEIQEGLELTVQMKDGKIKTKQFTLHKETLNDGNEQA